MKRIASCHVQDDQQEEPSILSILQILSIRLVPFAHVPALPLRPLTPEMQDTWRLRIDQHPHQPVTRRV